MRKSARWALLIQLAGGDDRIRTGDGGFADPCLTTWPRRPIKGAEEEVRTLDPLLGKEVLYR
jgi:hypothetical protein